MRNPKIIFCTTCKGRAQHLAQTLPRNIADNRGYRDCKFLVLDYNSQDNLANYLRQSHQGDIDAGRLVVYSFPSAERFQMAHAKNMAHRCAMLEGPVDILVNLDADNFTGQNFAHYLSSQFANRLARIYLWGRMVKTGPERTSRGVSGRIACTASAFLKLGGYDEQYADWGPDDKDFNVRLARLGYTGLEIDRAYLDALTHNDKMRFREYPHVASQAAICGEDGWPIPADRTIANFGRIGLGTVYRNFATGPIELKPLPTRIFGIGMHKTATSSLHRALQLLGFDSGHWESAHWAKTIWDEMQSGRSLTVEQKYALSDLPIPILYRELDRAYPGSKFILTTRDEDKWLRSVERHWSHEHNKFRASWNSDPFSHRVHKLVYGQKGFDAQIMLARYRRHNAEVREYFQGRGDLLEMQMNEGAGWPDLCGFLGCAVPQQPYPSVYITSSPDLVYLAEGI